MYPLYGHELCDGEKSRDHMHSAAFLFVNFPPINPILYLYYMIPLLLGNLGFPKPGQAFQVSGVPEGLSLCCEGLTMKKETWPSSC